MSREILVREVRRIREINASIVQLQELGRQHVARAALAAELEDYESLDEAISTITEEELAAAEVVNHNGRKETEHA